MKNILASILFLVFSNAAFGEVLKSQDQDQHCTLYQVASKDENGQIRISPDQTVISDRTLYGFSFHNMEIDFQNKLVFVDIVQNIVLGFDRPLLNHKGVISANNKSFNFLINQLNRSVIIFEKVCIAEDFSIVYANLFESAKSLN